MIEPPYPHGPLTIEVALLIVAIESPVPKSVEEYRSMLPTDLGLRHVTIEVNQQS